MSGGSLSSRVKNMKFMQVGKNKQKQPSDTGKEESNKLKDASEWSLPVNRKTMRVIKGKNSKIRRVGYSKISMMGPVNVTTTQESGNLGRKLMKSNPDTVLPSKSGVIHKTLDIETDEKENGDTNEMNEDSKKKSNTKTKKTKKSKKKTNLMDEFNVSEPENGDEEGIDLTSTSLLDMWKKSQK